MPCEPEHAGQNKLHPAWASDIHDELVLRGSDLRMATGKVNTQILGIASIFRGLYARVASRLDVDPSYVSRVARGERQSQAIETALDREANQILKRIKTNHNRSDRNSSTHHRRRTKRSMTN
jgi:hypothetical protein